MAVATPPQQLVTDRLAAEHISARRRIRLQLLIAAISSTIFYAWFITNGTFDFFGYERHGLAYGSLLLNILHGGLQVQLSAIGLEGLFVADKVYMSYGILPAFFRLPFVPFIDVSEVTVSRIVVLMMIIPTAGIWHYLLLQILYRHRAGLSEASFRLFLVIVALIAWAISPSFALCSTAMIYHETVAAALLLMSIFILVVCQSMYRHGELADSSLIWLAIVAALSLHARPEVAIGLYAGTTLYVIFTFWQRAKACIPSNSLAWTLGIAVVCMSILFASGALYLWMNWIRWGDPLNPGPGKYWGYKLFLFVDGFTGYSHATPGLGQFNPLRIPVNLVAYLFADNVWAAELGRFFGTGLGRMVEPSTPMLFLWIAPILIALGGGALWLAQRDRGHQIRIEYAILAIALATPALLLLTFPSINYRYKLLLWPILFLFILLGSNEILPKIGRFKKRMQTACLIAFIILSVANSLGAARANTYYKLFKGLDNDGSPSMKSFLAVRLFVPQSQLAKLPVTTYREHVSFQKDLILGKVRPCEIIPDCAEKQMRY